MGEPIIHLGQGEGDFQQASSFVQRLGIGQRSALSLIPTAVQRGQLVIARDDDTREVLGTTILDTTAIEGALFVPFLLVRDDDSGGATAIRRLLSLIFSAVITSNLERVVTVRDADPRLKQAVKDFNAELKNRGVKATLRTTGAVKNQFGDGRNVTHLSLFIPASARPNLMANLSQSVNTLVLTEMRISARISTGLGVPGGGARAFCSGCNEKSGKDKDGGKEGSKDGKDKEGGKEGKEQPKEGKDGKEGVELTAPTGKLNLELADQDAAALLRFYDSLGVRRFNAEAPHGSEFEPLV